MVLSAGRGLRRLSPALITLAANLACTSAPLDGKPCPCAVGYFCCDAQNICLPDGEICTGGLPFSLPDLPPAPKVPLAGAIVFAVSEHARNLADEQVLDLAPDVVIRGWSTWNLEGLSDKQYDTPYLDTCRQAGIRFMGGANLAALFRDQAADQATFFDLATRDAHGEVVPHFDLYPGLYWASLANPKVRQRAIDIGKLQIDMHVDGLNMIALDSDLMGQGGDGDEGFDDYRVADFNAYLLDKYPPDTDFRVLFSLVPSRNVPRRDVDSNDLKRNFDYRVYLGSMKALDQPLGLATGLSAEWGRAVVGRASPVPTSFLEMAGPYVYWKDIVDQLHAYAIMKDHPVAISAEGVYPFVDIQSVGLWDNATDNPNVWTSYVPLASGNHLDGTVSLQPAFAGIRLRSAALAPGAPVVVYLDADWDAYDGLPASERADYWRLYSAEALANGIFFAFNLYGPGDPARASAASLGLMPLFKRLATYARAHADLYRGVVPPTDGSVPPVVSDATVTVWDQPGLAGASSNQAPIRRRLVHIVNHRYDQGIIPQTNVSLTIDSPTAPSTVHVASPDQDADTPINDVPFADGKITMSLPSLAAYDVVVLDYE